MSVLLMMTSCIMPESENDKTNKESEKPEEPEKVVLYEYFHYRSHSPKSKELEDVLMIEIFEDGAIKGYVAWGARDLTLESIKEVLALEYPYGMLTPDGNFAFFEDVQMTKLFGTFTKQKNKRLVLILASGEPTTGFYSAFIPKKTSTDK
ncbi:MAG: hypothetical protein ACRCVN_04825 [Spirochaetia bacterium]